MKYVTSRLENPIAFGCALIACLIVGGSAGMDINWDLRNYHFYAGYAFFEDRRDADLMPSQLQSWFNPAGVLPAYLIIQTFPAYLAHLVFAALSAVSVYVVYRLARACQTDAAGGLGIILAALAGFGALWSPMFINQVGATMNDGLTSLPVLGALLVLVAGRWTTASMAIAGALIGLAVGLKLTNAMFAAAIAFGCLTTAPGRDIRKLALMVGVAVLVFIPVGGLWIWSVWREFGNPLFPSLNNIFESPAYDPRRMLDRRFVPEDLRDALTLPLQWALQIRSTAEIAARDGRFLIMGVLALLTAPVMIARGQSTAAGYIFRPDATRFLAVFIAVSLVWWVNQYGIQRYIVALEQIAILLIFILIDRLTPERPGKALASVLFATLIFVTMNAPNWGRAPHNPNWLEADFPAPEPSGGALYVMITGHPMAYVIPSAADADRFVRIDGNMPLVNDNGLRREAARRIETHIGPVRTLGPTEPDAQHLALLGSFGLERLPDACLPVTSTFETLQACPLGRRP